MGVKKSTVCTRALPGGKRTTAASSLLPIPVRMRSSPGISSPLKASSRSPGDNFEAQPAAVTVCTNGVCIMIPASHEFQHWCGDSPGASMPQERENVSCCTRRRKNDPSEVQAVPRQQVRQTEVREPHSTFDVMAAPMPEDRQRAMAPALRTMITVRSEVMSIPSRVRLEAIAIRVPEPSSRSDPGHTAQKPVSFQTSEA